MRKAKPNYKAIRDLLEIGNSKKTRVDLTFYLAATILATLIPPFISYSTKRLIDCLSVVYKTGNNELSSRIIIIVIIITLLTIISIIFNKIKEVKQAIISFDTSKRINIHIYRKLSTIKNEYYEDSETHDIIMRIVANCPGIYSILGIFISFAMAVISSVSYGIMLCSIRWYFVFLIMMPGVLCVCAETKNMYERYFLDIGQTNDNRKMKYMHSLLRDKRSNKEIRAYNLLDILMRKFEDLRLKLYRQGLKLLIKQSVVSFGLLMLSRVGVFICLFIVCKSCIINSSASIGDIALVISAGVAFESSFASVFSQVNSITEKAIKLNDWAVFENMKCEDGDKESIEDVKDIVFNNVSYKYPGTNTCVLKHINCRIEAGSTIALVGENGSGKTTFSKLILGALTPTEGEININGFEISTVLHGFRKMISYIPQNYGTFKLTLEDNLRLGDNSIDLDTYTPKFIDYLNDLPNGYLTPLGNVYNSGVDLSGGQWQRITIERAMIRKEAKLYIMDEPTASLDPVMESKLYTDLIRELQSETVIITSHRLGACSLADYIYVFDNGEIIEKGTHADLMSQKGKYYKMYTVQRSLYEREPI